MVEQPVEQQHGNAAAGNDHINALGHQGPRLLLKGGRDFFKPPFFVKSRQDGAGFEGHRMDAGHPFAQAVFADLVAEPGDETRVDGDDANLLP